MSETKTITPAAKPARPTWKPAGRVHAGEQPFANPLKRNFVEPDWRRFPGYKNVSKEEWETALWQRRHTIKNLKELKDAMGDLLPEALLASLERDIQERRRCPSLCRRTCSTRWTKRICGTIPCGAICCLRSTTGIRNGRATRRPAAIRCTNRTCGRWKA